MVAYFITYFSCLLLYISTRIQSPLPNQLYNKDLISYLFNFYNICSGKLVKVWELIFQPSLRRMIKFYLEGLKGTGNVTFENPINNIEPQFSELDHNFRFNTIDALLEPVVRGYIVRFWGSLFILPILITTYIMVVSGYFIGVIYTISLLFFLFVIPFDKSFQPCHIEEINHVNSNLVSLHILPPINDSKLKENMLQLYASCSSSTTYFAIELIGRSDEIRIQIVCHEIDQNLIEKLVYASFPDIQIYVDTDFLNDSIQSLEHSVVLRGVLENEYFFPIKMDKEFNVDPINNLLQHFIDIPEETCYLYQLLIEPCRKNWAENIQYILNTPIIGNDQSQLKQKYIDQNFLEKLTLQKSQSKLFIVSISLAVFSNHKEKLKNINELKSWFQLFARTQSNHFIFNKLSSNTKHQSIIGMILNRISYSWGMILSIDELINLFHFPTYSKYLSKIKFASALEKPIYQNSKYSGIVLGNKKFRGRNQDVVLTEKNRNQHTYILGATRTGKSTLLHHMILQDIKSNQGVAVLDPHGDLIKEHILPHIPENRINDVIYINPSDRNNPPALNLLHLEHNVFPEKLCSDLVLAFYRLFASSWGPRMEHILRYAIYSILEMKDGSLLDVLRILSDNNFRNQVIGQLKSNDLIDFWKSEFPNLAKSAIAPIQNKLSRFVLSPTLKKIFSQSNNLISFNEIMNSKKILLVNLSQGELGEDISHLLGAMIVSKLEQTALSRASLSISERPPFYLYVDEFQNYTTSSFDKILSEAGKYRLHLILCHQYLAQLTDNFKQSILGNVGNFVCFRLGMADAKLINHHYDGYNESDFLNLKQGQTLIRLGARANSFYMTTNPPLQFSNSDIYNKVIQASNSKYTIQRNTASQNQPQISSQPKQIEDDDFYE